MGLALALALELCARPAQAGEYRVTYSGGGTTTSGTNGTSYSPYGLNTGNNSYGTNGGRLTSWGTATGPNGTTIPRSSALHGQGTITATFTWQAA